MGSGGRLPFNNIHRRQFSSELVGSGSQSTEGQPEIGADAR